MFHKTEFLLTYDLIVMYACKRMINAVSDSWPHGCSIAMEDHF